MSPISGVKLYYKMRQILQKATATLLPNTRKVYYRMRHFFYYKMRRFLQNGMLITKCVGRERVHWERMG